MIPLKDQEMIQAKFAQELGGPVKIDYFTERAVNLEVPDRQPCAYCKDTQRMLQEIAGLSEGISLRIHIFDEAVEERQRFGVERIPGTVLRGPTGATVKFYGIPGGTEFPTFIETIVDLSLGETLLSEESVEALSGLENDVTVKVFVTPTCQYCPGMMRAVYHLALTSPYVRAETIEVNEFPDLADRFKVEAVPLTVINDKVASPGAMHEKALVEQVLKAAADGAAAKPEAGPAASDPIERGKRRDSGLYIP